MSWASRWPPTVSRVLINSGLQPILSDRGLAPRALRDIKAANRAGRFHVVDPELALAIAAGTLYGLGELLHDRPERDDAQTTDEATAALLRAFGMSAEDASEVCRRPLPEVAGITGPSPAA